MQIPISRLGLRFLALLALAGSLLAAEPAPAPDGTAPLPGETVFIPELRGVICVPDRAATASPPPAGFTGVDISRTPLLADPAYADLIGRFLGKPMSFGSLDRLCIGLRMTLRVAGQPFVSVYSPPQEVTGGVIRLVVEPSRVDGELHVEGAKWFSEKSYRDAVPVEAGAAIDAAAIQAGVERLNRNPYRRVAIAAEPGSASGTTKLTLRAQENRPWAFNLGYNNAGTAVTDENRISAGLAWGNAFGRGDTLGYSLTADPAFEHSVGHSANYGTTFASGRSLTAFGSYSTIESALPVPLTQAGTSWQAGLRYGVPLAKTAGGWERNLSFAADFKYSDNTLEFAAIPITNNVTHVAQFGASLSLSRRGQTRNLAVTASLYASPGGLTNRNDDEAFGASRAEAKATYAYGKLDVQFVQRLPHGFSWTSTASVQLASGALLGTEQLNGGGSAAVRGYRESSAFGDDGLVLTNELHLPGFSPWKGRDRAVVFAFLDGAVLGTQGPGGDTAELASAGLGLNYRFGAHFSVRAAYGWTLKELESVSTPSGRGHVSATLSF
jgi:hemolysin activation/secretion protein